MGGLRAGRETKWIQKRTGLPLTHFAADCGVHPNRMRDVLRGKPKSASELKVKEITDKLRLKDVRELRSLQRRNWPIAEARL